MSEIKSIRITKNLLSDVDSLIDEGIFLTGKDTAVKISEIDDAGFLQKLFYILQNREKRDIENYRSRMDVHSRLYDHILNRATELGINLQADFLPMQNLCSFPEFESVSEKFKQRVNTK